AEVRPLRKEHRENRRALLDYLKQDTVDQDELVSRLDALDAQHQAIRLKLRPLVLELAAKLEPEARARIIRRFIGGRRGRRWRRRH
ncbi:MAG: hypothetical protein ACR2O4_17455, partial [Hyphomicrobiaceae bacterium]